MLQIVVRIAAFLKPAGHEAGKDYQFFDGSIF